MPDTARQSKKGTERGGGGLSAHKYISYGLPERENAWFKYNMTVRSLLSMDH